MRDEPPLRQWQACVGDGIARARNIDKKTKSVESRATGNRKEKLKLKESMKHYFFFLLFGYLGEFDRNQKFWWPYPYPAA